MQPVDDLVHQGVPALRAMHRDGALLPNFFEQLGVLLTRPLVLARLLALMDFLAEAIFLVSHECYLLPLAIPPYSISLMSLPLRAFSTVSSNLPPRSTPICFARFLAHKPTLRESR